MRDPNIFTVSVPIGKLGKIYFRELVAANLNEAPKAPPAATKKKFIKLNY